METELRSDYWTQTYTGKRFYYDDIRPADICIEDIAHCLSFQCRFGGALKEFYSVAQHCLMVSELAECLARNNGWEVPPDLTGCRTIAEVDAVMKGECSSVWEPSPGFVWDAAIWGLLHDAAEAYVIDLPKMFKMLPGMDFYNQTEEHILRCVADHYEITRVIPYTVKRADAWACKSEAEALLSPLLPGWGETFPPGGPSLKIEPLPPEMVEHLYLDRLNYLLETRNDL